MDQVALKPAKLLITIAGKDSGPRIVGAGKRGGARGGTRMAGRGLARCFADGQAGETAAALTVTATSTFDNTKSGAASVTVVEAGSVDPTNANLIALSIAGYTLSPAFNASTVAYTASVPNNVTSVAVAATPVAGATAVVSGNTGLNVGANAVTVEVTAANGVAQKTYTITVTRAAASINPPSGGDDTIDDITPPLAALFPFEDVLEGDWFYNAVYYMWENELVNGTSATRFSPMMVLNRGMLVTLFYRIEGSPSVAGLANPFPDVAAGEYYANPVIWAANKGIVNGYADGTFRPTVNITREQMAVFLSNYQDKTGKVPPNVVLNPTFPDFDLISLYARDSVLLLAAQDIIGGRANGSFDPKGTATRAEFATMMFKFLTVLPEQE